MSDPASNAASPTVAALFVDPAGVYSGLEGVDLWGEARDARLYEGPWPVVAHPPCQKWCQLAPLNASRIEGYEVGDDGGCFASALASVRRFGGVLEHPALSIAWREFELPVPSPGGWTRSFDDAGYTTEVSQVAYGHEARKRTWLYAVGCDLPSLNWGEPAATAQVSAFGLTKRGGSRWTYATALDKGKSSYTPPSFRDVLSCDGAFRFPGDVRRMSDPSTSNAASGSEPAYAAPLEAIRSGNLPDVPPRTACRSNLGGDDETSARTEMAVRAPLAADEHAEEDAGAGAARPVRGVGLPRLQEADGVQPDESADYLSASGRAAASRSVQGRVATLACRFGWHRYKSVEDVDPACEGCSCTFEERCGYSDLSDRSPEAVTSEAAQTTERADRSDA